MLLLRNAQIHVQILEKLETPLQSPLCVMYRQSDIFLSVAKDDIAGGDQMRHTLRTIRETSTLARVTSVTSGHRFFV